jgi:hypothetical protein
MKRKVRIKSLPKGYHMMPDGTVMKDSAHMAEGGSVNKNLSPIPRGMANLEAEKGEVAMTDLGKTGQMGLYEIGGERHSNGGTPLNLDPGSFIYSDTRKMKIKDPEFLAKYGKSKPTTPAKLVKPFLKMNDFTNTLYDQNADPIQKRTAQTMIDNYKDKAGEIAFYQEAMKGFPQGIPAVAANYAEGVMGAPMAAYGGYIPKAQVGVSMMDPNNPFATNIQTPIVPTPFDINLGLPRPEVNIATPGARRNSAERIPVYTPREMELYEAASAVPGATYTAGSTALAGDRSRPAVQGMRADRSYGEEDITSREALANLKARQPWIFEEKPDWNFANPADVEWAQKNYEKRRKDFFESQGLTYTPYFKDKSDPTYRPGEAFDKKFGEHTFNMPALGIKGEPQKKEPKAEEKKETPTAKVPGITPATPTRTFPFQQDVNNLDTARRNRLSERRYFPYAPKIPNALADAVYLDDTRQQQQIAGRARGAMEALGAFAGPSRQLSSASLISGQAGDEAANVAATMGNANAQIANQLEQFNSQMQLRGNMLNAELAKNLFDETTTTLDTFDEKMRAYRTAENRLENTLETNRAKAQLLNQFYPDFQINTMPGMYGEITANPEVLRAMQDVSKQKGLTDAQKRDRQESINEIFTLFPVTYDKEGRDMYAQQRAALLAPIMKGSPLSAAASNPMADYLAMYSQMFPQQYGSNQ